MNEKEAISGQVFQGWFLSTSAVNKFLTFAFSFFHYYSIHLEQLNTSSLSFSLSLSHTLLTVPTEGLWRINFTIFIAHILFHIIPTSTVATLSTLSTGVYLSPWNPHSHSFNSNLISFFSWHSLTTYLSSYLSLSFSPSVSHSFCRQLELQFHNLTFCIVDRSLQRLLFSLSLLPMGAWFHFLRLFTFKAQGRSDFDPRPWALEAAATAKEPSVSTSNISFVWCHVLMMSCSYDTTL